MKALVLIIALFVSNGAFADTAEVICASSSNASTGAVGTVFDAINNLNGKLKTIAVKTVSPIQVIDYNPWTYVCVTITY